MTRIREEEEVLLFGSHYLIFDRQMAAQLH